MPFCPVPHTLRDQVWLGVGALIGAGVAWVATKGSTAPTIHNTGEPRTLHGKVVVNLDKDQNNLSLDSEGSCFQIREHVGNVATKNSIISIAHVSWGIAFEPLSNRVPTACALK